MITVSSPFPFQKTIVEVLMRLDH